MVKTKIPIELQEKANKIISNFNKATFKNDESFKYYAIYKGDFLYINLQEGLKDGPICRLRYKGNFDKWEFAIYKYSSDAYDANEWFFPGEEFVNGTIEGALKAGHKAYPPKWSPSGKDFLSLFGQFLGNKKNRF